MSVPGNRAAKPVSDSFSSPSSNDGRLSDAVADLERRVRCRETRACEAVCTAFPEVCANRESLLELIYTEHLLRQELGFVDSLETWQSRFPELQEDLRELFQVHHYVEQESQLALSATTPQTPDAWSDVARAHSTDAQRISRFELLDEIGRGGMGVVYRARQTELGRIVALKTITGFDVNNPSIRSRFRAEAEAAASLQHPHIVQIFEVGVDDDQPYFSMEYVAGGNLAALIRERPIQPRRAARLIASVARAIHYAHSQGIVHRDIKPANILLAPSDRADAIDLGASHKQAGASTATRFEPKVTDFGLARRLDLDSDRTLVGAPLGTPSYMSPEVADGAAAQAGPVCDVYSLGAVLYNVLAGVPPFHAPTVQETMERVRRDDPIPLRRHQPDVPRDLETICFKCLRKEPAKRYASAAELAEDLDRFLQGKPIQARSSSAAERLTKWVRRHPALASLIAAITIGGVIAGWQWRVAERNLVLANENAGAAKRAQDAEHAEREKVQRTLYSHFVSLAYFEHQSNNPARAAELLDACPEPLRNWEWSFVKQKSNERLLDLQGPSMIGKAVAMSPDAQFVAACYGLWGDNQQGELRVWNAQSGELLWSKRRHPGAVMDVEFDSTSQRLVSAGTIFGTELPDIGGEVIVWDAKTGSEVWTAPQARAHAAMFSDDDQSVVIAHSSGIISIHDAQTGAEIRQWKGHNGNINDLAMFSGTRTFVTGGRDGWFRIWNLDDAKLVKEVRFADVRRTATSKNGTTLAVSSFYGAVAVFEFAAGELKQTLQLDYGDRVGGLKLSPDGRYLVVSILNQPIRFLDVKSGRRLGDLPAHNGSTKDLAFSSDGQFLASGGYDGNVQIWSLNSPSVEQDDSLPGPYLADVEFLPDGHRLALASRLNTGSHSLSGTPSIRIWDMKTRKITSTIQGHTDWLTSIAVDPQGRWLLSGSSDQTARLWNLSDGSPLRTLEGHTSAVVDVAFSQSGDRALSATSDGQIRLWNCEAGSVQREWRHPQGQLNAIAINANESLIASAGNSGDIVLWSANAEASVRVLPKSGPSSINQLVFDRRGTMLAAARSDGTIDLWELDVGNLGEATAPAVLRGHNANVTSLTFSPDSKRLFSTSFDRTIKVWDTDTVSEVLSIGQVGLEGNRSRVAMSADGRSLARIEHGLLQTWELDVRGGDPFDWRLRTAR